MNFRKSSKRPLTFPHFWKIVLQFLFRKSIFNSPVWRSKICNVNFWIQDDPSPLRNFPKIHPFWYRHPSFKEELFKTSMICVFNEVSLAADSERSVSSCSIPRRVEKKKDEQIILVATKTTCPCWHLLARLELSKRLLSHLNMDDTHHHHQQKFGEEKTLPATRALCFQSWFPDPRKKEDWLILTMS